MGGLVYKTINLNIYLNEREWNGNYYLRATEPLVVVNLSEGGYQQL
jgi:hypothetical protein